MEETMTDDDRIEEGGGIEASDGTREIEAIVEDDPTALERHIERVHRGLESADVHERMDAGRTVRIAAEGDPEVISPHLDTVGTLLADENGSIQHSGAVAIAELAEHDPEAVIETVPALIRLLDETVAPAIEMASIRALTRVGEFSPEAITDADGIVAERLRNATPPIRRVIVTVFASAVIEAPSEFPATVAAIEEALADDSGTLRSYAAAAISLVASADRSVLSSFDAVLDRVETLEARLDAQPWHHDENVAEAAGRLRSLANGDQV